MRDRISMTEGRLSETGMDKKGWEVTRKEKKGIRLLLYLQLQGNPGN